MISGAVLTGYLFGKGVSLDDSSHLAQKEIPGISSRQALKWKGKKELGTHRGGSFCQGEMGKAILSHTQKQEAIRENEPSGEEEVLSKVKGVSVRDRVRWCMWHEDQTRDWPMPGRAVLQCPSHLRPSTAPGERWGPVLHTAVRLLTESAVVAQQRH